MKNLWNRIIILFLVMTFIISVTPTYINASPGDIKQVYLTFDDGPIPVITEKILDVLKEQNVKATFFVVGKEIPEREKILKRMYDEGHSIGLHTFSHKYRKVFRNDDVLIEEMLQTRKKVEEILGITPTAVRFPGGSSKHLTKELLDKLHSNNMKVFDWNVDLYDGESKEISVGKIVENSRCIKPKYTRYIILAHTNSNNLNTVKALPQIIKFYRDLNCEFSTIKDDTPEYYYRLRSKLTFNFKFSDSMN